MKLFQQAVSNGWDIPPETRDATIKMMSEMVAGNIKASPRERIRAAECLAKIDALNIAREGQDKSTKMQVEVIPPAYQQMPEQVNSEMVAYLKSASADDAPSLRITGEPEDRQ